MRLLMSEKTTNEIKEDIRIVRTKRDLADALEELLQERNFDELSVKDITDRALISKNTFYNNFQDKNELLNFLFERYREKLLKDIQPYFDHKIIPFKKLCFTVSLEKLIHAFYAANLPLDKMILADNSRSLFWEITRFIKNVLEDLDSKYNHFLRSDSSSKITSYFYAGAFASTLYFSILENNKLDEQKLFKSILKLSLPMMD